MKELLLKNGERTQVDEDVWEWARQYRWYVKNGYVARYVRVEARKEPEQTPQGETWKKAKSGMRMDVRYKEVYLHREIMERDGKITLPLTKQVHIHHRDRDPLNNRRENLYVVTPGEHYREHEAAQTRGQAFKRPKRRAESRFKGIHFDRRRGKWQVMMKVGDTNLYLGKYEDEEEAALVYDAAVLHYRGRGYTNLIPLPEEPNG